MSTIPQPSTGTAIASVLLAVVLLQLGASVQAVLLPVRGTLEGFSTLAIGGLGTAYYIGFVACCLYGGGIIRRCGHIRAFAAFAAVAASASMGMALAIDVTAWILLRVALGFCFAGLYMVIESWLNFLADAATRGRLLGAYMVVHWSSIAVGKLIFGLDDPAGFGLFALITIGICLSLVPVALTTGRAPEAAPAVAPPPVSLMQAAPVAVVGCIAVGLANGAFWSMVPLFAQSIDPSGAAVGLFLATVVVGGAVAQWPLGRASDSVDRRLVIAGACTAGAVVGIAMAILQPSGFALLVLAALYGGLALPIYSLCIAHANDHTPIDSFVEVSARLLMLFGLGAAVGPLAAAPVMDWLGPAGLFALTASVHVSMAVFALVRTRQRAPMPTEDKTDFGPIPRTTPEVLALDPRTEDGDFLATEKPAGNA